MEWTNIPGTRLPCQVAAIRTRHGENRYGRRCPVPCTIASSTNAALDDQVIQRSIGDIISFGARHQRQYKNKCRVIFVLCLRKLESEMFDKSRESVRLLDGCLHIVWDTERCSREIDRFNILIIILFVS